MLAIRGQETAWILREVISGDLPAGAESNGDVPFVARPRMVIRDPEGNLGNLEWLCWPDSDNRQDGLLSPTEMDGRPEKVVVLIAAGIADSIADE
jgi:hypothetical protein